jgi:hypothetical protein
MFYDRNSTSLAGTPRQIKVAEDEPWLGSDILIDYQNESVELAVSQGDLATGSGVRSIVTSLMRRLATGTGGYERYYRTPTGIRLVDCNLENKTYSKLSSLKSEALVQEIIAYLKKAAASDGRIEILEVRGSKGSMNSPLTFDIRYRIRGREAIQSLNYQL